MVKDPGQTAAAGKADIRRAYEFKLNVLIKRRVPPMARTAPGSTPARSASTGALTVAASGGAGRRERAMKNINIDFGALTRQFEGLQGRHPGLWPALPKTLLLLGAACVPAVRRLARLLARPARGARDRSQLEPQLAHRVPGQGQEGGEPGRPAQAEGPGRAVRRRAGEAAAQPRRDGCPAHRHQPGRRRPRRRSCSCSNRARCR